MEEKIDKHHSHEISDHPEVRWALELLKPDPNHELSFLSKWSTEMVCVGSGFAAPSLTNVFANKPFYAGIQKHITWMIGGAIVSQIVKKLVDDYQARRDSRLRDYIVRHPELFPEPERVKYAQVLDEWVPIR